MMNVTCSKESTVAGAVIYDLFQKVGWILPKAQKPARHIKIDAISNHTIYLDPQDGSDFLQKTFENSTSIHVAKSEGRIVGFVRVVSDRCQRSVIYDLVVDPQYQRHGIGKRLVELCLEEFSHTQITLGTSTPTMGFYERLGFARSENYMEIATEAY